MAHDPNSAVLLGIDRIKTRSLVLFALCCLLYLCTECIKCYSFELNLKCGFNSPLSKTKKEFQVILESQTRRNPQYDSYFWVQAQRTRCWCSPSYRADEEVLRKPPTVSRMQQERLLINTGTIRADSRRLRWYLTYLLMPGAWSWRCWVRYSMLCHPDDAEAQAQTGFPAFIPSSAVFTSLALTRKQLQLHSARAEITIIKHVTRLLSSSSLC